MVIKHLNRKRAHMENMKTFLREETKKINQLNDKTLFVVIIFLK